MSAAAESGSSQIALTGPMEGFDITALEKLAAGRSLAAMSAANVLALRAMLDPVKDIGKQLGDIAAAHRPASPTATVPEGIAHAAAELMRALQRPFLEIEAQITGVDQRLQKHHERLEALFATTEALELRTVELKAAQGRMAERLDILQQRDMATVRQLLSLYRMIADLEVEIEDWETAVQDLQRHGEEVGIEVVIVEAEPSHSPSPGKEKSPRRRRKPSERKK